MSNGPSPARAGALYLLNQVLLQGRTLGDAAGGLTRQTGPERATAQRLAADTLRGMARADRLLKPHLSKKPTPMGMNILRLGVVELAQGGASHGVVNDCVSLAAANKKTQAIKGLVNAVLRKLSDEAPQTWNKLPVPILPKWLRTPLSEAWGQSALAGIEKAHLAGAPLDLTAKGDPAALAAAVGGTLMPTGTVRLDGSAQVSALPGFDEGAFWVQDAAAAMPAKLLGDVTGLKVLDMCAAPGGKTLQLAAAGGHVTALDLSEARLERVKENLDRCGLTATVVAGDAMEHEGSYDAILLDAPCSATGTIRRHPELPHIRAGEGITELIGLQEAMLNHALDLLKPGGKLVFSTCSLIPDEGECHVEAIVADRPGIAVVPVDLPGVEEAWRSPEGGIRLMPQFWATEGGMDGFYMACLTKA